MPPLFPTIVVGLVATAAMDLWGIARQPLLGLRRLDYGLLGRWVAYLPRGRFRHANIATTPAVPGERVIGWIAHYLVGITFAGGLLVMSGPGWLLHPTVGPALAIGVMSVLAPLLIMHPGMGNGVAASRAPRPWSARLQSLVSHTVFGAGLYVGATIVSRLVTR